MPRPEATRDAVIFGRNGLVISAHRELAEGDEAVIRKGMADFIAFNDFDYIMFGGARGGDTVALAAALECRSILVRPPAARDLKLIVVVPDTLSVQPRETWQVSQKADRIIELRHPITRTNNFWALHHRNEFMLDWVCPHGRLLAFWNGEKSGTANAIHYARRIDLEVSTRKIQSRGFPPQADQR
jgi:hypothetical protein